MPHAIALYSGGLDSSLAILTLLRLGVKVTAVHFITSFGCAVSSNDLVRQAQRYGFELLTEDVSEEFLGLVKRPLFGYGKNMNPCIDCKIMMLQRAGEVMRQRGADCVATGEVVGQRPMSQQRHIFNLMEKKTDLKGYILRPLSALLLPPTIVEQRGDIDRKRLYGFSGRSRKPQLALAEELGLLEYPAPAGGCLLTEPNYSGRLRELLGHDPNPSLRDIEMLRIGRHFRLPGGSKLIIGRNEQDNSRLRDFISEDTIVLETLEVKGPLCVITNRIVSEEDLLRSAHLCARYSDGRDKTSIPVAVRQGDHLRIVKANPFEGVGLQCLMIKN